MQWGALSIRQIIKNNKANSIIEIDVRHLVKTKVTIEEINLILKKNMQINYSLQKLSSDQLFDWNQVNLINGSAFKNYLAVPESNNSNFQVVGDFTPHKGIYGIEGALQSAKQASELLL